MPKLAILVTNFVLLTLTLQIASFLVRTIAKKKKEKENNLFIYL